VFINRPPNVRLESGPKIEMDELVLFYTVACKISFRFLHTPDYFTPRSSKGALAILNQW
jgi:hypothetical protein